MPLTKKKVEMTGATHENKGRAYMNIALPLPFSSMYGILVLHQKGHSLQLTSQKLVDETSDAGIYLAIHQ